MERYKTYKDSGIEWIGEIPEHWEVKRLKYIGDSIIGITYSPKEVVQEGGTLVLRSSNIQNGKLSLKDTVYINKVIPERLETRIGDILICSRNGSRRLIGKNITIDEKTEGETFGAFMTVFRTEQYEFISKYFNSQVFSGQSGLFLTSTINQLTVNTLNNFYTALPPKKEQDLIAKYLDKKTNEIDSLIEQKKRLLKFYKDESKVIINIAITKGIIPEIELKFSGIDWLGNIPKHWGISKLKYLLEVKDGTHDTPNYVVESEDSFPLITSKDLKTGIIKFAECKYISREDYLEINKRSNVFRDDIIMPMIGTVGGAVIVRTERPFSIKNVALFKTSVRSVNELYIKYLLDSDFVKQQFELESRGGVQDFVSLSLLKNIIVFNISLEEQTKIGNHIENELKKINAKAKKTKKLISFLEEYKTVLISDVVTGKLKVT